MADNVAITAGSGTSVATDDVGGVHYQKVKVAIGAADTANLLAVGAGAVDTGTPRVTIASDSPDVAILGAAADAASVSTTIKAALRGIATALGVTALDLGTGTGGSRTLRVAVDSTQMGSLGQAAMASSVPVAIASNQSSVGVIPATKFVTVTMTTPSDAQDAGDVIAATQIVAACTPGNDLPGLLQSACLIDTDDVGVNIKAVFFSANTTLGTEDAAPDIDDTEALTVLGIVDFAAADYVDLGGSKYNTKTNIGLAMVPATGTDDVYMALYSPTGGTWASQAITVRLGFI
jgi:hypothetical protein